ncbi:MAG: hypothetical protein GY847_01535 [Proteobacteria bacterium]|nr:hypothetical protein [Pseudomonadota bacterium]
MQPGLFEQGIQTLDEKVQEVLGSQSKKGEIEIWLTAEELAHGKAIGRKRHEDNVRNGLKHKWNANPEMGKEYHRQGGISEKATAVHYGIPWTGNLGDFKATDCGPLEVRGTIYHNGCLRVHPEDRDEAPFLLAIVGGQNSPFEEYVRLVGWLFGREAKQQRWWYRKVPHRPKAFWVPQECLRPMDSLDLDMIIEDGREVYIVRNRPYKSEEEFKRELG